MSFEDEYDYSERPKTLAERKTENQMMIQAINMEIAWGEFNIRRHLIPKSWVDVENDFPCRPVQTRVTLTLDQDVAKFYRKMGRGYQRRINEILRLFMLARKCREIPGREDDDIYGQPIK